MDDPITICMSKRDADRVQEFFDSDDSPNFTILSRHNYPDNNSDAVFLEVICECTLHLWNLAKRVEMWNNHEDDLARIQEGFKNHTGTT